MLWILLYKLAQLRIIHMYNLNYYCLQCLFSLVLNQKLAFPQMHLIHNHKQIKQVIVYIFPYYYILFKLQARQFQPSNTNFVHNYLKNPSSSTACTIQMHLFQFCPPCCTWVLNALFSFPKKRMLKMTMRKSFQVIQQ